ncbi:MAG TPA: hypothetical protein VFF15_01390 [Flavobacteriaceae bacterium]|nr:hypothetical protein [Flavobacteriaceae bacterium]
MKKTKNAINPKIKDVSKMTESKTLRLKINVIEEIEELADKNNRNFNNMAETLMRLGMKNYPGLEL